MDDTESSTEPRTLGFRELGDVIADEHFPAVDLALRRGRHVHKDDEAWYAFLVEAESLLEPFYQRFGCELVHRSDGYFFLLPQTDALGKRQLSIAEMIVGQGLALAYLDPKTLESGGRISREDLLNQLATAMGSDALMRALNPQRRRPDERLMQRAVRQKIAEALRRLSQLGFVELLPEERLRLPPSLLRFAEPVKGVGSPAAALAQLLARGEISLGSSEPEGTDAEQEGGDSESDAEAALEGAGLEEGAELDLLPEDVEAEAVGAEAFAAGEPEPALPDVTFDFSDVAFDELPDAPPDEGEA